MSSLKYKNGMTLAKAKHKLVLLKLITPRSRKNLKLGTYLLISHNKVILNITSFHLYFVVSNERKV